MSRSPRTVYAASLLPDDAGTGQACLAAQASSSPHAQWLTQRVASARQNNIARFRINNSRGKPESILDC